MSALHYSQLKHDYTKSITKIQSRERLISLAEKYFPRGFPSEKCMISLCNKAHDGERVQKNSEFYQWNKSGVIQPGQYHGIDLIRTIIETNKNIKKAHWYNEDFLKIFSKLAAQAGIVNFDCCQTVLKTFFAFKEILKRATRQGDELHNILFAYTVILSPRHPETPQTFDELLEFLSGDRTFKMQMNFGWTQISPNLGTDCYKSDGSYTIAVIYFWKS